VSSRPPGRGGPWRGGRIAAVPLAATVVAACLPTPATAEGRSIADLYTGFMVVASIVATVVIVPAVIAIVRGRRRPADAGEPKQHRGSIALEVAWTAAPAVVVVGLFIATFLVLLRVDATDAPASTEIEVTGFRWGWTFRYPVEDVVVEGRTPDGPEVAVPVGEPVTIRLTSADVIHSFYVPLFLFKRDANPGRETTFQFTVEHEGTYGGQCAEFCGVYHARMPFTVLAMGRPAYEAWIAEHRSRAVEP
jgi:cytochrome c oxidase subunit 2